MNLAIVSVHNHGDAAEEYVLLKVLGDGDAGRYILADTTYLPDGKISSRLRHMFWLPDRLVRAGDFVIVRTGIGDNESFENTAGTTTHVFFWNLKSAVWNDDGDRAVLIRASDWSSRATR